jgi:hypothetical protein
MVMNAFNSASVAYSVRAAIGQNTTRSAVDVTFVFAE